MKLAQRTKQTLPRRLLAWFDRAKRDLPWRRTRNPYRIWVSEIMLQQTRVEAAIPYYDRWLRKFPTLESLARARPAAVLKVWEGLGYYSRARNLHAAAREIVHERGGRIPRTAAELRELRGIGRYTAGAIASIAFGERAAVVDGNVSRVLARLFAIRADTRSAATHKRLWRIAEAILPPTRVGDFNQALMELGATICVSRSPRCGECPLANLCIARRHGLQQRLPLRALPRKDLVTRWAAIVRRGGKIFLTQRPRGGRLAGFWELPSVEGKRQERREKRETMLRRVLEKDHGLHARSLRWCGRQRYSITRFAVTLELFEAGIQRCSRNGNGRWVSRGDLRRFSLPAADRRVVERML